ncbi:hypothetical protein ElyMa_000493400 [Elysia marginata]|uniref:Uncharacterized protein n=1 Tax=Elysia marginata TaxID=1093978 RepID=A0AAV4FUU9_9GAST|nr:hypothetical protein ElyMa_000493400 [Elysia marginata]
MCKYFKSAIAAAADNNDDDDDGGGGDNDDEEDGDDDGGGDGDGDGDDDEDDDDGGVGGGERLLKQFPCPNKIQPELEEPQVLSQEEKEASIQCPNVRINLHHEWRGSGRHLTPFHPDVCRALLVLPSPSLVYRLNRLTSTPVKPTLFSLLHFQQWTGGSWSPQKPRPLTIALNESVTSRRTLQMRREFPETRCPDLTRPRVSGVAWICHPPVAEVEPGSGILPGIARQWRRRDKIGESFGTHVRCLTLSLALALGVCPSGLLAEVKSVKKNKGDGLFSGETNIFLVYSTLARHTRYS